MLAKMMVQNGWVLYTGYRYNWTTREIGLSLAAVGVMGVIVQGFLIRRIVPWLGEHRAIVTGLTVTASVQYAIGFCTSGWLIYVLIPIGAFGGLAEPATQSVISRHVAPEQQGAVQGALSGLNSLAGIFGPPLSAWSFGFCISRHHTWHLPGIAFFESASLVCAAVVVAYLGVRRIEPSEVHRAS
jgi:DHA1 family tetracycline resistance protein-like MFS transporter